MVWVCAIERSSLVPWSSLVEPGVVVVRGVGGVIVLVNSDGRGSSSNEGDKLHLILLLIKQISGPVLL